MADYGWPDAEHRTLIGKRISRVDSPVKVSGQAKYTYDVKRPGMLFGKILRCPYAYAKVVSIDASAAEKMPGVMAIHIIQGPNSTIHWAGDEVVAVAAVDEPTAEDAVRARKVKYQKAAAQTVGDGEKAFAQAEVISEGLYGVPVITHCCLESHGSTSEWTDNDHLLVHMSTQNVSGIAGQMAEPLKIPATNIRVHQDHIGGGFGSKFSPDRWGIATAEVSKKAGGKPVRIMLERDSELKVAGARPSAYARVRVGAKGDGTIVAWQSESWGTGGPGGGGMPPIPYVFSIPNQRKQHTAIRNNIGPARAWRAPNHPQAAVLTMCALDDLAAKLNMDPLEFFLKNIELTKPRQDIYREELAIASDLMGWKQKWRPRGQNESGGTVRGVGVSFHTR